MQMSGLRQNITVWRAADYRPASQMNRPAPKKVPMTGAFITLNSKIDDAAFSAFQVPAKGTRKGGAMVLREIFGVDAYTRHDAEHWASLGFEALAPSLFDRCEPGFVGEHTPDGLQAGFKYLQATRMEDAIADIATCVDYLAPRGPV